MRRQPQCSTGILIDRSAGGAGDTTRLAVDYLCAPCDKKLHAMDLPAMGPEVKAHFGSDQAVGTSNQNLFHSRVAKLVADQFRLRDCVIESRVLRFLTTYPRAPRGTRLTYFQVSVASGISRSLHHLT